jgi:hypothetical protein
MRSEQIQNELVLIESTCVEMLIKRICILKGIAVWVGMDLTFCDKYKIFAIKFTLWSQIVFQHKSHLDGKADAAICFRTHNEHELLVPKACSLVSNSVSA